MSMGGDPNWVGKKPLRRLGGMSDALSIVLYTVIHTGCQDIILRRNAYHGHAVLKVIMKEQLQQNAFAVGSYLKECLMSLKEKYEIIGDVRGRENDGGDPLRLWVQNGMYLGMAFTRNVGDNTAEKVGVTVPELSMIQLTPNHLLLVVASDGVFEFLSSQAVKNGDIKIQWFKGGVTNICYNALDTNIQVGLGKKTTFFWEGNDLGQDASLMFNQLFNKDCQLANYLKDIGVKKGDAVVIYLPMLMELLIGMLACARIGVVHSVVFARFSSPSLSQRIVDCKSKAMITCNDVRRGSKVLNLKDIVDAALVKSTNNGVSIDVIALDINLLVSGTNHEEFEELVKKLKEEIKQHDDVILFIDKVDTLIEIVPTKWAIDGTNILRLALVGGEFQILKGHKEQYETHHMLRYTDGALVAAARLSFQYISNRSLPDKAIDLIDEAGSLVQFCNSKLCNNAKKLKKQLRQISNEKIEAVRDKGFEKVY
ncbi:hypothetical protein GIB67_021767 [Kingdonia uniflora]|uniref:acetate--CoA ligase n=1 Tax=Kingdonia uniflora TaxID=39325 RepID=A0A7J7M9L3_9MAGN|nr:hypothetical protein GIB67_021767 [Kingdonia uniflora]